MPERNFSSPAYRYGFNGMEKDDEIKGVNNSYNTTFRVFDPRIGRWKSLDPLMTKYPEQSNYSGFNNNPIYYRDPTGLEGDPPSTNPVNKIQNIDADMVNSLVDMAGSNSKNTNSLGWARDSKYFWEQFKETPLGKSALDNDNLTLIQKGKSPIVNEKWNEVMGKYDLDGKLGEGIEHHHHNKGRSAYPRPKSKHTSKAWNSVLHKVEQRYGKIRQKGGYYSNQVKTRGTLLRSGVGKLLTIMPILDFFTDSPHSARYMLGNGNDLNRAYYDSDSGLYYEITEMGSNSMKLQFYQDYTRINDEWRGIMKVGGEEKYIKVRDGAEVNGVYSESAEYFVKESELKKNEG